MFFLEKLIQGVITKLDKKSTVPQKPQLNIKEFMSPLVERGNPMVVVHISDLHNAVLDKNYIVQKLQGFEPDAIFITGDGGHNQSKEDSFEETYGNFLANCAWLAKIAPTFYVEGNHDHNNESYLGRLKEELETRGVIFLQNGESREMEKIKIFGVSDSVIPGKIDQQLAASLGELGEKDRLTFLLAHRPGLKFRKVYARYPEFDLTFCGHAHGGQWRIPFLGVGLAAPDEGLLPKSTSGFLNVGSESWVHVSRGSSYCFGPRLFNQPEITLVVIKHGLTQQNESDRNHGLNILAGKILR